MVEGKGSFAHASLFLHGSTVAINALLERKGAKTALLTTRGFRDVLELGRYRAPRLYDLTFRKPDPLVERRLRFEAAERMGADGASLSTPAARMPRKIGRAHV